MKDELRISEDRYQRIVKVMRDSPRDLSERTQTLLPNDLLLGRMQFVDRFLQALIGLAQLNFRAAPLGNLRLQSQICPRQFFRSFVHPHIKLLACDFSIGNVFNDPRDLAASLVSV